MPDLSTVLASLPAWRDALEQADVANQREVLASLIGTIIPRKLGRGRYEAEGTWTQLRPSPSRPGWYVLVGYIGEPNYEDVRPGFRPEHGVFDAYDARKAAYWALFAGAHGHTYGANGVFQFWDGVSPDRFHAPKPWQEAIQLPGAAQMRHARRLLESRPFLERVPDRGLVLSAPGLGADHTEATRGSDGGYAFVYSGAGKPFIIDLGRLSGRSLAATWYDPRTGEASAEGSVQGGRAREFRPPSSGRGNDWVLVLDDEDRGFGVPGAVP